MDSWYRERCDEMAGRIGGLRACLEMAADYARLGVVPTAGTVEVWRRWIEDGRAKGAPTPGDDLAAARLQADLDAVSRGAIRAGDESVLPVADEGQVVVAQPLEKVCRFADLDVGHADRRHGQRRRGGLCFGARTNAGRPCPDTNVQQQGEERRPG